MADAHPANHFSLRALKRAVAQGYAPESLVLAMRRHVQMGETVYVFDDREGEAEHPRWTVSSEDDMSISAILALR